eukprot:g153.t1
MATFAGDDNVEPRYMKRRVKAGIIEADFDLRALIVHYEVEATVLGDHGEAMQVEKKSHTKRIRLKQLNENTNVPLLAEEIVEQCKLIHHSKLPLVQELVFKLQQRSIEEANSGGRSSRSRKSRSSRSSRRRSDDDYDNTNNGSGGQNTNSEQVQGPKANIENVDEYMELLYDDDMKIKVKGTAMIMDLARDAGNLEALIQNESLMGALSRVLKEDYKKSMDLTTNLMYIFFSFSNFTQMHGALTNYRVGAETMRVIDLEVRRHALRMKEIQTMGRIAALQERGEEVPRDLWELLQECNRRDKKKKGKRKSKDRSRRQEESNAGDVEGKRRSEGDDNKTNNGENEGGDNKGEGRSSSVSHKQIDIERERNKMKKFIRKQDKLLFVCLHVLMNIAEDVQIERKIVKRKCVKFLSAVLLRTNAELLILCVNFLKKLSIFEENKNRMVEDDIVPKLVKFIPCSNKNLMKAVTRLLLNLSFDPTLRDQMVKQSLVPKLVDLLKHAPFRQISLKVLYHLSMDDACKSMFTYTEAIPIIMQMLINFPNSKIPIELIALAINLSHNARNAEMMAKEDLLIEVLGTIGNLTVADLPDGMTFADLIVKFQMIEFLQRQLVPGMSQDDTVLCIIEVVGCFTSEHEAARVLVGSPIINSIHEVMRSKMDDDEIVLQALWAFLQVVCYDDTYESLIYETNCIDTICSCLGNRRNAEVRRVADEILTIVMDRDRVEVEVTQESDSDSDESESESESDSDLSGDEGKRDGGGRRGRKKKEKKRVVVRRLGELGRKIRATRYTMHNQEWLRWANERDMQQMEEEDDSFDVTQESDSDSDESESESESDSDLSGDEGKRDGGRRRGRKKKEKKRVVVRRLGELGRKIRATRYTMHNQEWLRWANERDMQQMEEEDDSFDGIGRHNFQHSRSDDSHGDALGSDLDHSGQFVGSLGRHETVQMAGFESDDDDDFYGGGGQKFNDNAAMY